MLSFFPRGVLDETLNLIESVSEGFPPYFFKIDLVVYIRFEIRTYLGVCDNVLTRCFSPSTYLTSDSNLGHAHDVTVISFSNNVHKAKL